MTNSAETQSAPGRIVLFNGPPSSGKTSLVNALIDQRTDPWFHLSLDEFHAAISERFWRDDGGELFERLIVGYLGAVRAIALAGFDVMAEAVLVPARRSLYDETFGALATLLIAVRCPLDVVIHREKCRSDRRGGPIDFPADYFEAVYSRLTYDFEVASETANPSELALLVGANLDQLVPSSFATHLI